MDKLQKQNINIGIISNIMFEPNLIPLVNSHFGETAKLYPIPYGEHNDNEHRTQLKKSNIIIVWLNFETAFSNIWNTIYSQISNEQHTIDEILTSCKKLYADISAYPNVHILWFLFDDYFSKLSVVSGYHYDAIVDKINIYLTDALKKNVSFINLKRLIAEIGIASAYDPKGKYRWNAPYSKTLVETVVREIHKQYLIEKGISKKCLVLDCDNVLWGGIISEDGIDNLKLGGSGFGRSYQDFQRYVLSLYYHGVILAICSKNDLSDVLTMFREHSEMILKEEHIACFQSNWDNKPDNIKRIAETLNISLDTMVFVDDVPIEVEAVKSMLPEVTAMLYDRDSIYEQLSCFNLKNNVNIMDISKRNETYRTNQFRDILKSQYKIYGEYIAALDIKTDIHESLSIEFSRISELTQRTNKCTNGKRYMVSEIKERVYNKNVKLYSLSATDHFSDLGLVGAFEIEGNTLTLFSLSCRALGRELEKNMLAFIKDKHEIDEIKFYMTGKNKDIETILLNAFPNARQ